MSFNAIRMRREQGIELLRFNDILLDMKGEHLVFSLNNETKELRLKYKYEQTVVHTYLGTGSYISTVM